MPFLGTAVPSALVPGARILRPMTTKTERLTALMNERTRLANHLRGVNNDKAALQAAIDRLSIQISNLMALPDDLVGGLVPSLDLFGLGRRRRKAKS
jgi:hypothetical protein